MQGRPAVPWLAATAALLLISALPLAAADVPSDARSGTYPLGPHGVYHPFILRLATSDLVHIQFRVTPAGAATDFTFHLHAGTSIITYLNVTTDNYSAPFNVPSDGLYGPQWVNLNAFPVNITYAILIYHNGLGITLPSIPTPLLLLVGLLGGAVGGLEGFLWLRNRRQGRHA